MAASVLLHKRKRLFLVILFIAFSAFTADILDLREELSIYACTDSILDNDVSTGLTSNKPFILKQMLSASSVQQKTTVEFPPILYLLPNSFRAPPSWS